MADLDIHRRCDFSCVYCGLNGRDCFDNWLQLSKDHLLPSDHSNRNDEEFIVTACRFCNETSNLLFSKQIKENLPLERDELIAWRKQRILENRVGYRDYWLKNVANS